MLNCFKTMVEANIDVMWILGNFKYTYIFYVKGACSGNLGLLLLKRFDLIRSMLFRLESSPSILCLKRPLIPCNSSPIVKKFHFVS